MLKVKEKKLQTELVALENQGLQGENLHEINNNNNNNNNNLHLLFMFIIVYIYKVNKLMN